MNINRKCMFCDTDFNLTCICEKCENEFNSLTKEEISQIKSLRYVNVMLRRARKYSKNNSNIQEIGVLSIDEMSPEQLKKLQSNIDVYIKKIYWSVKQHNNSSNKNLILVDEFEILQYEAIKELAKKELDRRTDTSSKKLINTAINHN